MVLCQGIIMRAVSTSHSFVEDKKYAKFYAALELPSDSSQDNVRRKYIELAKKYHPDTPKTASRERFQLVDEAYRELLIKFRKDKLREKNSAGEYGLYYEITKETKEEFGGGDEDDGDDIQNPDIEHTAPQHRRYLDNDGFGAGTPGQRQRQHQQIRAMQAAESVTQHRVEKMREKDEDAWELALAARKKAVKKHVTRNAVDRLVEDLISESMAKGDFDNLKGAGKPLPERRAGAHAITDFTRHKVNEIIADSGFAPEWIMLRKDILASRSRLRDLIRKKSDKRQIGRERFLAALESDPEISDDLKGVNKMIDDFNLQVPWINAQMFHVQLDREFDLAIVEGKRKEEEERQKQAKLELDNFVDDRSETRNGFREIILQMFFGKDRR